MVKTVPNIKVYYKIRSYEDENGLRSGNLRLLGVFVPFSSISALFFHSVNLSRFQD